MAAGRPVIASDLEVVRELGRHEEHLLLSRPGSVDAIAEAVMRLRCDPALATNLASNARRLVEERYTWTHAVASLIAVYRGLTFEFSHFIRHALPLPSLVTVH